VRLAYVRPRQRLCRAKLGMKRAAFDTAYFYPSKTVPDARRLQLGMQYETTTMSFRTILDHISAPSDGPRQVRPPSLMRTSPTTPTKLKLSFSILKQRRKKEEKDFKYMHMRKSNQCFFLLFNIFLHIFFNNSLPVV
jgi:hypothetical protein